ncbi:MAG: galactose-1-phosphate uridylyltransferase [Leptospiraceae bacterium]|nr:galactose-1-phosphate uridylyltransferase [Leptospiraceae bacterium]
MSEIRQNIITRDWVIIATDRARRPHEFQKKASGNIIIPPYKPDCPFCVGHEHDSTTEYVRINSENGWQVRVIANKYPALSPEGDRLRWKEGINTTISGVGIHDVVIETPVHNSITALLPVEDIYSLFLSFRIRYNQIAEDKRMETIVIFKNHGESAGSSLEHPHCQIAATPVVPYNFRSRIQEVMRYFDDHGDCIFCRTLLDEIAAGSRIIAENVNFIAFIPYAALTPFHIWVFPREHTSSYEDATDSELKDLASIMKKVLSMLYYALGNPDYNFTIRSAPLAERRTKYYHWYLSIVPRITKQAGFEMGSGMFINTALPEESAEYLKNTDIPVS